MIKPDALGAIARKIDSDWGCEGYGIRTIEHGPLRGGAIAEVWATDGAVFFVASDRYGNTRYADTREECEQRIEHFREPLGAWSVPSEG